MKSSSCINRLKGAVIGAPQFTGIIQHQKRKPVHGIQNRHYTGYRGIHMKFMFKLTIPSEDDFYTDLMEEPHVVRVVALSGGYTRNEADEKLARNHGLIASFSRALLQGLNVNQSDKEFDDMLAQSVKAIYEASIT